MPIEATRWKPRSSRIVRIMSASVCVCDRVAGTCQRSQQSQRDWSKTCDRHTGWPPPMETPSCHASCSPRQPFLPRVFALGWPSVRRIASMRAKHVSTTVSTWSCVAGHVGSFGGGVRTANTRPARSVNAHSDLCTELSDDRRGQYEWTHFASQAIS